MGGRHASFFAPSLICFSVFDSWVFLFFCFYVYSSVVFFLTEVVVFLGRSYSIAIGRAVLVVCDGGFWRWTYLI